MTHFDLQAEVQAKLGFSDSFTLNPRKDPSAPIACSQDSVAAVLGLQPSFKQLAVWMKSRGSSK